jgi:hypothetical protein
LEHYPFKKEVEAMADRDWMLNPTAIKAARCCIAIVQDELGVKLTLSHPQFLELLKEYVELTDSGELQEAYNRLINYAGTEAHHFKAETEKPKAKVSKIRNDVATQPIHTDDDEFVVHKGKAYKRFDNGKEFKGLYRGQARYA